MALAFGLNANTEYQEILNNRNVLKGVESTANYEEYSGPGEVKCYGQMSVTLNKAKAARKWITGTGSASCLSLIHI